MYFKQPFLMIVFLVLLAGNTKAQTPAAITAGRLQAAQNLLVASDLNTQMGAMYANIIEAGSAQIPADKKVKFKEVMTAFLNKYMGYASLRDDMAKIYAEEFTEDELKDITIFYLTPAGKKMNQKLAVLQQKGMAVAQQKMQSHMGELQESMKAALAQ
ncbi:DUF2059 domain-containing protein [Mucilaginibacter terrae]|uniref:DUF2059 domain-containing protein n=1 Tax=Mucilaginibacter terrae TaxID=1955052 RepID=UPI0036264E3C